MTNVRRICTFVAALLLFVAVSLDAQVRNTTHPANSPYLTIQAAISDAITVAGDTITVAAGTYAESVTVNKALFLFGTGNPTVSDFTFTVNPVVARGFDVLTITVVSPAKIQEGVDALSPTGSLGVEGGTYNEHVVLNKSMNLIGSTTSNPTINAGGTGNCITLASAYIRVKNVILTNAVNGIGGTTTNSQLRFITILNNTGSGMSLSNSDYNLIHSNDISGHTGVSSAGIELVGCRRNTITGNNLHSNAYNIRISGTVFRASLANIVQGNMMLDPGTWSLQVSSGASTSKVNLNVFRTTVGGDKFISNTTSPAETLEARHNWFQGHDHPGKPTFPTDFQGLVDSLGWFDNSANTNIAVYPFGYNMSVGDPVYVSVMAFVPPARQVRATRVTLTWNNTVASMEDGEIPGTFFKNRLTAGQVETFSFTPDPPVNSITVFDTLSGGSGGVGGTTGLPYVGTLFLMKYRAQADGLDTLKLSGIDIRDENLQPLPQVVNLSPGSFIVGGSGPSGLILDATIWLQGPFNGTSMDTTLRHNSAIPLNQPYNVAPWNYAGTENVSLVPTDVVDWVLVELRTGTAANTKFATRAGWLKSDGSIRELPGLSPLGFTGYDPGNYYVVIHHRNHLSVMSATALPINDASVQYDFTTGSGQYFGGAAGAKDLGGGVWGMIAGNGNGDGTVNAVDRNSVWRVQNGSINGYYSGDFNLNGTVNAVDRNTYWRVNNGLLSQVP